MPCRPPHHLAAPLHKFSKPTPPHQAAMPPEAGAHTRRDIIPNLALVLVAAVLASLPSYNASTTMLHQSRRESAYRISPGRFGPGAGPSVAVMRLRGGESGGQSPIPGKKKIKGEKMAVNTHGSWNIGGQWAKGGKKIKYMQTEDGMGLSRAKMRREKKKWKRDYGDLPEVDKDMENEDTRERGLEATDFAPGILAEKMQARDKKQQEARRRRLGSRADTAKGLETWQKSMQSKAADGLDSMAKSLLEQEEAKLRRNPGFGHSFRVSGAGTPGVNGVYETDMSGDFDKIGTAFSNGDYILLFERAGKELANKAKIKKNRWLIFNDEEGVGGSRPYYELQGKYSDFNKRWTTISGQNPEPKVTEEADDSDEDLDGLESSDGGVDDDGGTAAKGGKKGGSHRDKWLKTADDDEDDEGGATWLTGKEGNTGMQPMTPSDGEDAWKDLENFVKQKVGKKNGIPGEDEDRSAEDSSDPLGVDLSTMSDADDEMAKVAARVEEDLQGGDLPSDAGGDVGWPEDDAAVSASSVEGSDEEAEDDQSDESSKEDSAEVKETAEAKQARRKMSMMTDAMLYEGVKLGMGFKEIEEEIRAEKGEYRGTLKQIMAKYQNESGVPPHEKKKASAWKKAPLDTAECARGRVELARSAKSSKGGQKVTSTRYRTVAAALYHACELGGGVVTIDKGEYEEETTLFVGGKITIRPKDGARVVIRGPKGKTVMQCQDPEAKVLVVGIEFVRVGKKGEQGPAVHVEAVEWNSCLRVSCGVVRLSDCKVSGEGCVGILCGRGGLAQLISCKVIKCGSDGVAAADGGMVVANRTLFSRNGDNGCSAQGQGSTLRLQGCNVCNNGNNGVHSEHGAKVFAKGCALDRNTGSGAYVCGVPIVAMGMAGSLGYGDTNTPGASLELTDCRLRSNTESGMTVVQFAHGKMFRCSANQNAACGVSVISANATVDRTTCTSNVQHGVAVESTGWVNVSRGNLSCNGQNGVAAFGVDSVVYVSACHVTRNIVGLGANEQAEINIQGEANTIRRNSGGNEYEGHGGRVYLEYTGFIHPIFDRARHLINRKEMTQAQIDGDSSHDFSFENNLNGEMPFDVVSHPDSDYEFDRPMTESNSFEPSEAYDEKMMHDHKPGAELTIEGDLGGEGSSADANLGSF